MRCSLFSLYHVLMKVFRQCSCSNVLQVTDASGAVAYNIAGSCLQCGPKCV